MIRFMGMMPSDEIEISKRYRDSNGLSLSIDAGPHGWTVTYADYSTDYADSDKSSQENFDDAFNHAVKTLGELTERTR